MGRLAGFPYREVVKRLKELGLEFHREAAGSHEIWLIERPIDTRPFPIIRAMFQGTLRTILKQAGAEADFFLQRK